MSILITGGAGYIGSHIVHLLERTAHEVVIVDDMSSGIKDRIAHYPLLDIDLAASNAVDQLSSFMQQHEVDEVIHLAAKKSVDESVVWPLHYYDTNVTAVIHLLEACHYQHVERLVFSSTAAVYGAATDVSVSEGQLPNPINPYGASKVMGERMIADVAASNMSQLQATSLRYFNVAGCLDALHNERQATNLIPMVIERLLGNEPPLVFGEDYPTPDGTCIRDFIHVLDVAEAHIVALNGMRAGRNVAPAFNVGTGKGHSVLDVISELSKISGNDIEPAKRGRRNGDPPRVVANTRLIRDTLDWEPSFSLSDMAKSAWAAVAK